MDINTLNAQARYLQELTDITRTITGTRNPQVISLKDANDLEIYSSLLHPDLDGKIHLDISDIVRGLRHPEIPTPESDSGEMFPPLENPIRELKLSIGNLTTVFSVILYDMASVNKITEADFVRIPKTGLVPFSFHMQSPGADIILETSDGRSRTIHSATRSSSSAYPFGSYLDQATMGVVGKSFRFVARPKNGASPAVSPWYHGEDGDWNIYCFYSPHGVFEFIPMSGRLTRRPEVQFDVTRTFGGVKSVMTDKGEVYDQESGVLTYNTWKYLLTLLKSDFIYVGETGEHRIIITDIKTEASRSDDYWTVKFSYRYANL